MLRQKLQQDQINALKNKDQEKLDTLRFLISKIKNQEIDLKKELTDEEIILIIKKNIKELNESIEAFKKANRIDLLEKNQKQLNILTQYLPSELPDEQLKNEIEKIINNNQEIFQKNKKAIIGIVMKNLRAKADSSRILKILEEYIK